MVYIYDILLNFNKNLIEYFEWEEKDSIKYIKKIALFKVGDKLIKDIVYKNITFSDEFINNIPKYEMNGRIDASSVCLFTNSFIVIGVLIKDKKPILISRLLLDEEKEVLEISDKMETININYVVDGTKKIDTEIITRKEKMMKEQLFNQITKLLNNKDYDKLFYLYYEYTSKENKNIHYVYTYLIDSLKNFNDKHKHLFDILMLSDVKFNKN